MKKLIFLSIMMSVGFGSFAQVKPKQIQPGTNGQLIIVRSGIAQWDSLKWADISGIPAIPQGTVTSVGISAPTSVFTIGGSPVTSSGTLALSFKSQTANQVFAAPSGAAGVPTFRTLVPGDIPNLPASIITSGVFPNARLGTGTPAAGTYVDGGTGAWTALPGGTVTSVSATAPLHVTTPTTTPALTIDQANGTTPGYLSSADWLSFNGKASLADISATAPITYNSGTGKIGVTTGNLVAGTNVTMSGTLTSRLVGSGNVTISATVDPTTVYGTEDTLTHTVVAADISAGVLSITLPHTVKAGRIPMVWINGVKARWPSVTWSGTTLSITNANLPYNVSAGDEIDIKYVY